MARANAGFGRFRSATLVRLSLQRLAGGDFVEALGDRVLGSPLSITDRSDLAALQESPAGLSIDRRVRLAENS